jgi:hypothetical protein
MTMAKTGQDGRRDRAGPLHGSTADTIPPLAYGSKNSASSEQTTMSASLMK